MRTIARLLVGFVLFAALGAADAAAEELKVHYGLLHAHTLFSDGSGTPAKAYERAASKVDFFAVTPHNHAQADGLAKERKEGSLSARPTGASGSRPSRGRTTSPAWQKWSVGATADWCGKSARCRT